MTCCTTASAKTMAVPTSQLTRATQCQEATFEQLGRNPEQKLRMSWAVVTDNDGKRQLRIKWERATENVRSACAAV